MPYIFEFEPHGVLICWSGNVTSEHMLDYQKAIQSHPEFDRINYEIHDFRHCISLRLDSSEIELIAALDYAGTISTRGKTIKIAVIADDPIMIGAVDTYMACGLSPCPMKVFGCMENARSWIATDAQLPLSAMLGGCQTSPSKS